MPFDATPAAIGVEWCAPRDDGMTITEETIDGLCRDGTALFAEHCLAVGEAADEHTRKNWAVMRRLEELGGVLTVVARSNGRMFGYLSGVIAPSLELVDLTVAQQSVFFVSADAPCVMLGLQLQYAFIAAAKARGVAQVIMRAGVRGDGPRLGALYRYLGAEPFGQLFRLTLGNA
jgi:hypothetical protein